MEWEMKGKNHKDFDFKNCCKDNLFNGIVNCALISLIAEKLRKNDLLPSLLKLLKLLVHAWGKP